MCFYYFCKLSNCLYWCYYICAHFSKISFAHSFHLRTEMYIICAQFYCYICAHVFTPLPWPAAGILLNQDTTNKVSSLLPGCEEFQESQPWTLLPRGHVRISLKQSLYHLAGFASYLFSFLNLKPSYKRI